MIKQASYYQITIFSCAAGIAWRAARGGSSLEAGNRLILAIQYSQKLSNTAICL
jgi:hypothetical protein